jgi:steroid delta-isomerase-like uncharacterized protein
MSVETNQALARRFREELFNTGNLSIADEICSPQAVHHVNDPLTPDFGPGPEGLKQIVSLYRTAFPDARCTVEDLIAEEGKVLARWTARGTHQGNLGDIAPTGRQVTVTGMDVFSIAEGKIQESWINWDTAGMLRQLGATQLTMAAGGGQTF